MWRAPPQPRDSLPLAIVCIALAAALALVRFLAVFFLAAALQGRG
jgi:hypothetical protein